MDHFVYKNGELHCEDLPLSVITEAVGTPAYIYSKATFTEHYKALSAAFAELDPIVCYSIKSCGNISIVKLLASLGSGMDVVSGGELYRAKLGGADLRKVVYAGVGKTDEEIRFAIEEGIGWFNIESEAEFENIARIAKALGKEAHGALRVNPDVADDKTHDKTTTGKKETKFGVDIERAKRFFETYGNDEFLKLDALHLHIGSPIYSPEPYVKAIEKTLILVDELRASGHTISALDIGGGFAADYETGASPSYQTYADAIVPLLRDFKAGGGTVILEPGRTIAANAGVLATEVLYIKQGGSKTFVIVDTGMHHLIRPTLYEAYQFVWPTKVHADMVPPRRAEVLELPDLEVVDIVGPICETGDYIAKGRAIPRVERGDQMAIFGAGAYGMVMASNYNAHGKPAEVMVDGEQYEIIRRRETWQDLVAHEQN